MATYHKYECKVLALLIGKSMNGQCRYNVQHSITNVVSADIVITDVILVSLPA